MIFNAPSKFTAILWFSTMMSTTRRKVTSGDSLGIFQGGRGEKRGKKSRKCKTDEKFAV